MKKQCRSEQLVAVVPGTGGERRDGRKSGGVGRFRGRVAECARWCGVFAVASVLWTIPMSGQSGEPGTKSFYKTPSGEIEFNTGVLKGKLRAGGKSAGLSSVIHIPTGLRIDSSMGLLSHYRVFTTGKRYGVGAWDWPSEAVVNADGSVSVEWAADPDRPFKFSAVYRWITDSQVEVETVVKADSDLRGFESFLACYFAKDFTNSMVCAGNNAAEPFVAALETAGVWQAFPRDDQAARLIRDGRWKLEPNPVDWTIQKAFSRAIGARRAPGLDLTAGVWASPEDCFAICTPHQAEGHYSMYFSLFGRDLKKGESSRARTRFAVYRGLPSKAILEQANSPRAAAVPK